MKFLFCFLFRWWLNITWHYSWHLIAATLTNFHRLIQTKTDTNEDGEMLFHVTTGEGMFLIKFSCLLVM